MTGFLMQAHAAQIKTCSEFAGNAIAITECVGELIPSSGFYQCVRLLPPGAGPALQCSRQGIIHIVVPACTHWFFARLVAGSYL